MKQHGSDGNSVLAEELAYFREQKDTWLQHHEGKFALVKGRELIDTFTTEKEAYEAGVKAFGEDDAPKGQSYQWDAVFEDGDLYKAGLGGQALYVSPETDTVVVYFSTTWQNSLSMISYARAIVQQKFREQ